MPELSISNFEPEEGNSIEDEDIGEFSDEENVPPRCTTLDIGCQHNMQHVLSPAATNRALAVQQTSPDAENAFHEAQAEASEDIDEFAADDDVLEVEPSNRNETIAVTAVDEIETPRLGTQRTGLGILQTLPTQTQGALLR